MVTRPLAFYQRLAAGKQQVPAAEKRKSYDTEKENRKEIWWEE